MQNIPINKLEKSYNPRIAVPYYKEKLQSSLKLAENIKKKINGIIDIKYGKGSLQTLDVYGASNTKKKPIHVFIHGGYWRGLDKKYHSHMAIPFLKNNIIFINLNYDLCPKIKLSSIKIQLIEAIKWIKNNAEDIGGDYNNIVISGHSAGAHLTSQLLGLNLANYGLEKNTIKGAALVSGIYEPEIVLKLQINKEIGLTLKEAKNNNTLSTAPFNKVPIIIAVGSLEPTLWQLQSTKYFTMLKNNNFNTNFFLIKNNNHFSLIDSLANRRFKFVKSIVNLSK